jgi:hypothetical protein
MSKGKILFNLSITGVRFIKLEIFPQPWIFPKKLFCLVEYKAKIYFDYDKFIVL